AERHRKDAALVAERLGIDRLSRGGLPELHFSAQRMFDWVATPGGEARAVRAKGYSQHGQAMSQCRTQASLCSDVPELRLTCLPKTIAAACQDAAAVGMEGHGPDGKKGDCPFEDRGIVLFFVLEDGDRRLSRFSFPQPGTVRVPCQD